MNSKVKVLANEDGSVLNLSQNNPDYAWIRVQQIRTMIDEKGFLKRKPVNALIPGSTEDMKASNFFAGQELPGNVLIKESLIPFNAENPSRDLKIAGDTGIICSLDGLPIYRKTIYSMSTNAEDIIVQHDNKDVIKAAFANSNKANTEALQSAGEEFGNI
jgi:hypothetical protein